MTYLNIGMSGIPFRGWPSLGDHSLANGISWNLCCLPVNKVMFLFVSAMATVWPEPYMCVQVVLGITAITVGKVKFKYI